MASTGPSKSGRRRQRPNRFRHEPKLVQDQVSEWESRYPGGWVLCVFKAFRRLSAVFCYRPPR
jgi:hypothetical protein